MVSPLTDFTLSNARQFYLSKGDSLGSKGLKKLQNFKATDKWVYTPANVNWQLIQSTQIIQICLIQDQR